MNDMIIFLKKLVLKFDVSRSISYDFVIDANSISAKNELIGEINMSEKLKCKL